MPLAVLCLNGGSSSLKVALYGVDEETETLHVQCSIERIGTKDASCRIRDPKGRIVGERKQPFDDHDAAVRAVFDALEDLSVPEPAAAGHRLVHGGPAHLVPERVTPQLLRTLRDLIPFAPLHLPSEIGIIEAVGSRLPNLPQVACFDTAFHRDMPDVAQRFPLPRRFWKDGLHRYGFHGLSYEFVLSELGEAVGSRAILAHLGNGASMVAVRDGNPIDTTMGFTPAGGFMMGTRSGDIDPGVIVYLMRNEGLGTDDIEQLVNNQSGLLGVSGLASDMRTLLEQSTTNPDAAFAVELFCYQLRKTIGGLAATLGGLDTLVFTGGIGEKAAAIRWKTCQELDHLAIRLDESRNDAHAEVVSAPGAGCTVRVLPTQEDRMIARHTRRVLLSAA